MPRGLVHGNGERDILRESIRFNRDLKYVGGQLTSGAVSSCEFAEDSIRTEAVHLDTSDERPIQIDTASRMFTGGLGRDPTGEGVLGCWLNISPSNPRLGRRCYSQDAVLAIT